MERNKVGQEKDYLPMPSFMTELPGQEQIDKADIAVARIKLSRMEKELSVERDVLNLFSDAVRKLEGIVD